MSKSYGVTIHQAFALGVLDQASAQVAEAQDTYWRAVQSARDEAIPLRVMAEHCNHSHAQLARVLKANQESN